MAHRIDTHIHIVPDRYRQAVIAAGGDPSGWFIPEWTPDLALAYMDRIQVQTAIWSITSPGPAIAGTGSEAHRLAKACNEDVARICAREPRRFRYYASLPSFLDVPGCLDTLEHAQTLDPKPSGIVVMTNYGDKLVGHPDFDPIWAAMDRLRMIVFIHPASVIITPKLIADILPQPTIDYPQQTTRTAVDLLLRGHLHRYANIRVILSHAGGTLPYLYRRVSTSIAIPEIMKRLGGTSDAATFKEDFKKFYFDLAMSGSKTHLYALLQITSPDKILYGSDWPYGGPERIAEMAEEFGANVAPGAEFEQLAVANADNARRLFAL